MRKSKAGLSLIWDCFFMFINKKCFAGAFKKLERCIYNNLCCQNKNECYIIIRVYIKKE